MSFVQLEELVVVVVVDLIIIKLKMVSDNLKSHWICSFDISRDLFSSVCFFIIDEDENSRIPIPSFVLVLLQNYTMWHAVETSIQSFNKNRRLNMSFRKTTTSNKEKENRKNEEKNEERMFALHLFVLEGSSATNPISRPICSITDLMKKTRFTKEEIRHFYRSFKQVNLLESFILLPSKHFRIVQQVKSVKNISLQSLVHYFQRVVNPLLLLH